VKFLKRISRGGKSAARGTARGISGAARVSVRGLDRAGGALGKVPVVGGGLKGAYSLASAPYKLTARVVSGERIDKAAMTHLREQVRAVKAVAPYARVVISTVPGVGQGISGAMAAGIALAEGQPITVAIKEGVRGSLPGGPLARAAFDAAEAAVQGKPLNKLAVEALPLDVDAKKAMLVGLQMAQDMAKGKRIDESAFLRTRALLPKEAEVALVTGIAIAKGEQIQRTVMKNITPSFIKKLAADGSRVVSRVPVFKAGGTVLKAPGVKIGFQVGANVVSKAARPAEIAAVRARLQPAQKRGFDIALSTATGMASKPAPKMPPREQFAFFATHGMKGNTPDRKAAMMKTIAVDNSTRAGATAAIKQVAAERMGLWRKIKKFLGIK
jgi:hypothetical protein